MAQSEYCLLIYYMNESMNKMYASRKWTKTEYKNNLMHNFIANKNGSRIILKVANSEDKDMALDQDIF